MRQLRRFGHGERARVGARVRAVLESDAAVAPAARPFAPTPADSSSSGWVPDPLVTPAAIGDEPPTPAESGLRRASGTPAHARAGIRVDPGRRGAGAVGVTAVGVTAVVAAVVTAAWVFSSRPHAIAVTETGGRVPATTSPAAAFGRSPSPPAAPVPPVDVSVPRSGAPLPAATGPPVVVDVVGRVRHPGVYTLPAGARVYDAVIAAGGTLPGVSLSGINLAAKLVDGQDVPVGLAAPLPGGPPPPSATGGGAAGPVDLNSATVEQLETLPGVGPVLAQHILDWRTQHGRFTSVDQLHQVAGIGDVKFAALRGLVSV